MALSLPNTVTTDYSLKTVIDASANTSISTTLPSSRTVGEGMLAFICSTRNALSDITGAPTGWQLEGKRATGATTNPFVWIYSKIVDGTENGAANATTFTWSGGTPGDTGDDVCLIVMVRGNVDASDMVGAMSAFATGQSVSPTAAAISTTADGSLVLYFACAVNGNRITLANANNPSGSTNYLSGASRAFSVGEVYGLAYVAVPTTGTSKGAEPWTNFLNNSSTFWTCISLEIKSSSVLISNVNGGAGVKAGSTGNTITYSGNFNTTTLSIGTVAMTNIVAAASSATFDCPAIVDNTTGQSCGTKTVAAGNGSITLNTTASYDPPLGYKAYPLSAPINTTVNGVVFGFSPAAVPTDQLGLRDPETVSDAYGNVTTSITGTQNAYHYSTTTSKWYTFDIMTGGGRVTLSATPLTASPLKASPLGATTL